MIFVFGSNRSGIHGAGAAAYAHEFYGAEWGVGEGLTGSSYALPTKGYKVECLPWSQVHEAIGRFVDYAKSRPDLKFALTPVGTGLAGHSKKDVWESLQHFGLPSNVYLTSTWVTD